MRFMAVDILILFAVFGGLYVVYRWLLQQREYMSANKVLEFVGGPLDGKTVRLRKMPDLYNYQYDKPKVVQATEDNPKPTSISSWYIARYERTIGAGAHPYFEYKGSTPVDKLTTYDLPEIDD